MRGGAAEDFGIALWTPGCKPTRQTGGKLDGHGIGRRKLWLLLHCS